MKIINNETSHYGLITSEAIKSDKLIVVSPFLMDELEEFIIDTQKNIKEITIYTKLKEDDTGVIKKASALKNYLEFCTKNKIELKVIIDNCLHAKIYIFYKNKTIQSAIISSANFTESGLNRNHEVGVFLERENEWDLIEKELETFGQEEMSAVGINELFERAEKYRSENNVPYSPSSKIDISGLCSVREVEDNKMYFIKPIGNIEKPFDDSRVIEEQNKDLYFSKRRPRAVEIGSILICYAVNNYEKMIGAFEVVSEIKNDSSDERYPHYVCGKNLYPGFSNSWAKNNISITKLAAEFNKQFPGKSITYVGGFTLGALNYGSDKIRITSEFANYIINKIELKIKKM